MQDIDTLRTRRLLYHSRKSVGESGRLEGRNILPLCLGSRLVYTRSGGSNHSFVGIYSASCPPPPPPPPLQMNPRERDSQMFEIYKFVEQTRGRDPVIMTGDYNTKPSQHAYKFLVTALDLQDVYHDDPTDTCDLVSNMFTKKGMTPKRIDFVLYSDSRASSVSLSPEV